MSTLVKGLVGAAIGLIIGFVIGGTFGYGMIMVLVIFGFELGTDALAMGTVTGTVVGASIMAVMWRFDPLFLGNHSRILSVSIGVLLGGILGYMNPVTSASVVPGVYSGAIVGLIGGALVGLTGLDAKDREPERTNRWDSFYERHRGDNAG